MLASPSEKVVVNGDLKDANLLEGSSYTGGNIEIASNTAFDHNHVFNGAHGAFSGNYIMSVSTGPGKDFVFTNRIQLDSAATPDANKFVNISGTGAIEFGVRNAVDGLAANTRARDAIYFYTGDVSIGNSIINADSLSLNGLELGNNSQFRVGVADLDLSTGAISATGVAGSTLRLDGHAGANYNLADVLNLTNYAGEVSLNNATINLASASDLGSTYVLTLGENAILSSAGVAMTQRLHIGGDAAITNTSGTTSFGINQGATNTLSATSITVKAGAILKMSHVSVDFTGTDINLEGATLHSGDIDAGANGIQLGMLTLSGNTTISHEYNGTFSFTGLTGSGALTFNADAATNEDGFLKINSVTNYNGTITFGTGDAEDKVIMMGAISQNADSHMVLNGRMADTENVTFSGEGSVSFNAGMRHNGASTLESGTLNISSIEFTNTTSSLAALGSQLNLNGASFDAATNGTLKLGAAIVGSSEASVTFGDKIELGAHATGATAGTAESPIVTTINTTQTDSADGVTLHITGDISDASGSVGSLNVIGNGSLTLSGNNSFTSGLNITQSTITFANDGGDTYTLDLVRDGTIDATNWLTDGMLDMTKIQGALSGRNYSYANGVLSYTLSGKSLTWNGGDLVLAVGTDFSEGGAFANNDSITYASGSSTNLVVNADVSSATVVVGENASITTFGTAYELSIGELTLEAGATLRAGSNVVASLVTMEDASFLEVSSLSPIESATLNGSAHLSVLNDQAAGLVSIGNIIGGNASTLTLYLSAEGSSLQLDNFTGNLNVAGGQMLSSLADSNDFASVTLAASTSYEITDTLGSGSVYDLSHLKGDADSTLMISGTGVVISGVDEKTRIELSNEFMGAVELLSGTLSGEYSIWGGSSKIILHDGTERVLELSGALTGDSSTTIKQTDGGTLSLTGDLSQYAGTLSVEGYKISIDADASQLNKVLFTEDYTLEIGTNRTVTTVGVDSGKEFYERATGHGYNIVVGAGSTFTDNAYLLVGTGTIDISGGGTYSITGFMRGNANGSTTNLNIAADTTLMVTGTTESGSSGDRPSFMLGHYTNATANITVDGTLDIASGLSNRDGSGTTTVNVNGALTQKAGSTTGLVITGTASQTVSLNAANSYAGGTSITGANVVAGNASAFGTGAVTLTSGALNFNGQAISNNVTVNGGSISGFSAFTGTVSIASAVTVSDTITGGISVLSGGILTLDSVWDYSSAITNAGTLILGDSFSLDLTGVTFTESSGIYSLNLFDGMGDYNYVSIFSPEGAVDTSKLTGVVTDGYTFSYADGTLSYTATAPPPPVDIIVPGVEESISGADMPNIVLQGTGAVGKLSGGFTQAADTSISGDGSLLIAAGETATLNQENFYKGTTGLEENAVLNVAAANALGEGALNAATNSDVILAFELLNIEEAELVGISYNSVNINVYEGDLSGAMHTLNPLGVTSLGTNAVYYIPEPSAATLSLLALTALLARRRRKNAQ